MTRLCQTSLVSLICCTLLMARPDEPWSGLDPDGFDTSVRPQDDLYLYVNGRWLLRAEIPSDKSNYGAFTQLDDAARENIRTIIESSAESPADETQRKIAAFFDSYMDTETVEDRGIRPLERELNAIQNLGSRDELFAHLGHLQTLGVAGPVGFGVTIDAKNSSRYLAAIVQSGTTLPDRDYYLEDDEKYLAARKALTRYAERLFELASLPDGAEAASTVLQLETELARIQWSRTELRDAEKRYNLFQVRDLEAMTPGLAWSDFFAAVDVPDLEEVNVMTPDFFEGLQRIGAEASLRSLKQYVIFHLLDAAADYLPGPFADAHFGLHRRQLAGVPERQPRWKRAVDATSGARAGDFGVLGDAVGELYVAEHFRPAARDQMDQLVDNLLTAYESSISELTWMTDATKEKALAKLHRMTRKIGYPSIWRDYSGLVIEPDDLLGNMQRSARFEHAREIRKLGRPVDKAEWNMTPQTVNAYYNPTRNEIVFPAAILQPPFFDPSADAAVNYGAIGAVIGHEISHGFDDQGSRYDGDGNLHNWWTDEDRQAFERLTQRLVAQFESYEALPGRHLNGKLTLGENIADLSGLSIAWKAYTLSRNGDPGPGIDGHTAAQRFFLGWSQVWRRKYREPELVRRLLIDPHAPSQFRANGPVTHLDAFHEAFNVQPGDGLYRAPDERIRIW